MTQSGYGRAAACEPRRSEGADPATPTTSTCKFGAIRVSCDGVHVPRKQGESASPFATQFATRSRSPTKYKHCVLVRSFLLF